MSLDDALRAPPRLLVRWAGGLLPVYLLAASAPGVARTPLLTGLALAVAYLAATGRLDPVAEALRGVDVRGAGGVGPGTGGAGGVDPAAAEALSGAVAGLATPVVVALLAVGGVAALVVLVLARGVAGAATLAAVDAGLRDDPPVVAGVRGVGAHWRAFVALTLVRALVYLALLGAVVVVGGVAAAAAGPAGAAVAVLLAVLALPVVVAVELLLAFAGPAVVVDDVGAAGALRRAAGLARDRPGAYVVLLFVAGAGVVGVGVVAGLGAVAGVGRAVALLVTLVVAPLYDGLRTALYADREAEAERPRAGETDAASPGVGARLRTALGGGLVALARFVRDHPGPNLGAAALLSLGGAAGWALVAPYGLSVAPPSDVGSVFGAVPVGPFVNIAANNWLVGAGAAYGGLAAGLPTVAAMGINGALLGAIAGVTDPTAFLALVGPHATLELPAIAVAGGLGLHLGRVGVAAVRGRRDAAAVAATVRRAFRVLVGLGVVFVVAAAIEAFVTPAVAAAVLG